MESQSCSLLLRIIIETERLHPKICVKEKNNNYNEHNNKNINWIPSKNALNVISYMPKYLFLSIFLESSVISFYCLPVS